MSVLAPLRGLLRARLARWVARDAQRAALRGSLDLPKLVEVSQQHVRGLGRCADPMCLDLITEHALSLSSMPCLQPGCPCQAFVDRSRL